jgi:hypothetical protein
VAKDRRAGQRKDFFAPNFESSDHISLLVPANELLRLTMTSVPGGDSQCFDAPEGVPQSNEFKGKHFFVRECYQKYYDDILKLLNSDGNDVRMVSVTGTPGIGKSLFYLYFYKRYLNENQGQTLLTASFNKTNELEECIILNPSANQGSL